MTRIPRRPTGPTSSVNYAASMGAHLKLTTRVSVNTSECNKYRPDGTPTKKFFPRSDKNYDSNKGGKSYAQLALQVKELKREAKRAYKKRAKSARGTPRAKATPTTPEVLGLVVQGN